MPTITRSSKKEPGEVMQSMKEEIASSMAQDRHPLAAALQGGEWVTPDLIKEMAKRPVLAKGMSNPKYQARFAASVYTGVASRRWRAVGADAVAAMTYDTRRRPCKSSRRTPKTAPKNLILIQNSKGSLPNFVKSWAAT